MKWWIAIERVVLIGVASGYAIYFFSSIAGCAGRRPIAPDRIPQEEKFFRDCQQTVPATADGFQHFICNDPKQHRWEVLVRKEPK